MDSNVAIHGSASGSLPPPTAPTAPPNPPTHQQVTQDAAGPADHKPAGVVLWNTILTPSQTMGIIGGGNMGQAIAFPLFDKGLLNPANVTVSATSERTLENWKKYGCRVSLRNEFVIQNSSIVIWAVKPQVFPVVIENISKDLNGKALKDGSLHISIMAGVPLERFVGKIKHCFSAANHPYSFRAIRSMPNIGLQVGTGVTVFSCGPTALDSDRSLMFSMFQPIGLCYEVVESQINAYCGLFGSGIGFMFPILEGLSDGAVKMGIPRAVSLEIAAQVMKGAGELYLKSKTHPGILKDMVCSPGGTTIAGVSEMERGGIRSIMITAIEAATTRGDELGKISMTSGPVNPR